MKIYLKESSVVTMVVILILASCTRDNFLEIQPRGNIIPSTVEDFRLLLDNVVQNNALGGNIISNGFDEKHLFTALVNDNHTLYDQETLQNAQRNAFLFQDTFYTVLEQDPDWNSYYSQIFLANFIIDGLGTVTNGTATEIAALEAEARLHRAFAYFNLVNIYALHYDPSTADTALGVPIREGIELENIDLTRATVQEVYDLVLADILIAIDDLQEDTVPQNFSFRPSKAAAWGLLSKVYLYQAEYELALEAVNNALSLQGSLRDLNNDEFSLGDTRSFPRVVQDPQIVWFKQTPLGQSTLFPSDELLTLYTQEDLRNDWFIFVNINATIGQQLEYLPRNTNENFADGINTPELYLIRAECNARLSNFAQANEDLNTLRENRFAPDDFFRINITDQTALLNFVKDERRRELVGNYDRTFDIKRYNLFDNDNISLTHTLGNVTATLEANALEWAFPIGEIYIQQNPEIVQNPRN